MSELHTTQHCYRTGTEFIVKNRRDFNATDYHGSLFIVDPQYSKPESGEFYYRRILLMHLENKHVRQHRWYVKRGLHNETKVPLMKWLDTPISYDPSVPKENQPTNRTTVIQIAHEAFKKHGLITATLAEVMKNNLWKNNPSLQHTRDNEGRITAWAKNDWISKAQPLPEYATEKVNGRYMTKRAKKIYDQMEKNRLEKAKRRKAKQPSGLKFFAAIQDTTDFKDYAEEKKVYTEIQKKMRAAQNQPPPLPPIVDPIVVMEDEDEDGDTEFHSAKTRIAKEETKDEAMDDLNGAKQDAVINMVPTLPPVVHQLPDVTSLKSAETLNRNMEEMKKNPPQVTRVPNKPMEDVKMTNSAQKNSRKRKARHEDSTVKPSKFASNKSIQRSLSRGKKRSANKRSSSKNLRQQTIVELNNSRRAKEAAEKEAAEKVNEDTKEETKELEEEKIEDTAAISPLKRRKLDECFELQYTRNDFAATKQESILFDTKTYRMVDENKKFPDYTSEQLQKLEGILSGSIPTTFNPTLY